MHMLSESPKEIFKKINSSLNAILNKKSICEGYTNMMHYLLTMVGVESKTVSCNSDAAKIVVGADSNHSIIKVKIDGNWYYFDPTWDAGKNQYSYFFKTKDEISATHKLSMSEDNVPSLPTKKYTNKQLSAIFEKVISLSPRKNNVEYDPNSQLGIEKELDNAKNEYGSFGDKIEALMKLNESQRVHNYDDLIQAFQSKRDLASNKISLLIQKQKGLQTKIIQDEKNVLFSEDSGMSM